MQDDQVRQKALAPFQSFIVQAPAGSGKTQLLTLRILTLLAQRVTEPESILAITFTRKAAQEMKRRVIEALQMAQRPEPQKDHERMLWRLAVDVLKKDEAYGWGLLLNPQRLRIMTIDALCSSITYQLPLSSRLGANPECVEYAQTLYLQAAQNTLKQCLNAHLDGQMDREAVSTLLLHLNNRQSLAVEAIAHMLASREQWLGLVFSHDASDHAQLRVQLEHQLELVIHDSFEKIMADVCGVDWDGLALYLQYAASNGSAAPAFSCDSQDVKVWRSLAQWLCTQEGELRKTVDVRLGFPAASSIKDKTLSAHAKAMKSGFVEWLDHVREDEKACAALMELRSLPDPQYPDQQWNVLKALFHLLPKAVEHLYLLFELKGQTDFSAIARCALTALGGNEDPTELDLKLDHAIHHMLVDEFQDTSIPQFELIRRMVAHWDNTGEKTLFLVGDPMQSIYRFREAEVGGFLQAQRYGMGPVHLESLHLSSNFRSEKPIIDWINQYMPAVFATDEDIYLGAIAYAPFEAQISTDAHARVNLQWIKDDAALGPAFVDTITPLLSDNTVQSIAILVRNRGHINAIVPALRQAKIPYQAVEMEKITQTPCVRQLLQLTRAYLNLADSQAWLSVLMSPFCGLSLADLTHMKASAEWYYESIVKYEYIENMSETGRSILRRVAPLFSAWINDKNRLPLAQAIEGMWHALGGPASLPSVDDLTNAQPFFDLLQDCDEGGTLNWTVFEKRLDLLYSKSAQSAKIQIMTIHKSKGLEFDVVLIPSLERQPRASEKPLLLWESCPINQDHVFLFAPIHATQGDVDPIYEFIWKKHKIRERNEHARLLYVALTRAKKQLYLFAQDVKPHQDSFLRLLKPAFDQMPFVSNKNDAVDQSDQVIPLSCMLHRLNHAWQHPCQTLVEKALGAAVERSNPFDHDVISPSRFEDRMLGTLIHKILYLWAEHPTLIEKPMNVHRDLWRALITECALSLSHLLWVEQVMLRVQSDPRARALLAPHDNARNEFEVSTVVQGKVKTFIMDRTFVDPQGVRVIVDYKTGEAQPDRYWAQLEAYAQLFQVTEKHPIRLVLYFPVTGDYVEKMYEPIIIQEVIL